MSIQALLQKGPEGCGALESIADGILAPARLMWLGREIEVKEAGVNIKPYHSFRNCKYMTLSNQAVKSHISSESQYGIFLFLGTIFILGSILASPFLAAGLACKKIALIKNPKGQAYYQLMKDSLEMHILAGKCAEDIPAQVEDKDIQSAYRQYSQLFNRLPVFKEEAEHAIPLLEEEQKDLEARAESLEKALNLSLPTVEARIQELRTQGTALKSFIDYLNNLPTFENLLKETNIQEKIEVLEKKCENYSNQKMNASKKNLKECTQKIEHFKKFEAAKQKVDNALTAYQALLSA